MRVFLTFFLLICLLTSCTSSLNQNGDKWKYFPSVEHLETGVVNKYYFHYWSNDGYKKSTDIRYYKYQKLDEQRLNISIFDPGFELISRMVVRLKDDKLLIEDEIRQYRGEILQAQLEHNTYLNWKQDSSQYTSTVHYPYDVTEDLTWKQVAGRDTSLMGLPAKIITKERKRHYQYSDQEDRHLQTEIIDTYVQNFGLFSRNYTFDEGIGQLELIKQMPLATFETLSQSVPERVAFIDPNNTLDPFTDFAPCNGNGQIYDYYNGEPSAHFRKHKRGLWDVFNEKVDPSFLEQESGYLTFRFIVNCVGETGWFVTEEADLNFDIKTFSTATVSHLFEIVRELDDWQPAMFREEAIDAYVYITLKLKDGGIIEILP